MPPLAAMKAASFDRRQRARAGARNTNETAAAGHAEGEQPKTWRLGPVRKDGEPAQDGRPVWCEIRKQKLAA
jgi:hypothetical protein